MRGTHIYNATVDPDHPLHYMQDPTQTRRHIHNTPATHYRNLTDSLPPAQDGESFRRRVHTHFTREGVNSLRNNTLLDRRPPDVNPEERLLPRADRVHLTRLRCGHHPAVPAYRHRIGLEATDACTMCGTRPGTVKHLLLDCPQLHTQRNRHNITTLENLWNNPVSTRDFLWDWGDDLEAHIPSETCSARGRAGAMTDGSPTGPRGSANNNNPALPCHVSKAPAPSGADHSLDSASTQSNNGKGGVKTAAGAI